MTTKPTEPELVAEVEVLLAKKSLLVVTEAERVLWRRLVEEVKTRDKLIVHMHVHSGYPNNGYMQMTTPQKELYDAIWNRAMKEEDEAERRDHVTPQNTDVVIEKIQVMQEKYPGQRIEVSVEPDGYCCVTRTDTDGTIHPIAEGATMGDVFED